MARKFAAIVIAIVAVAPSATGQALAADPVPAPHAAAEVSPTGPRTNSRPVLPVERLVYRADGTQTRRDTWSPSLSADAGTLGFVSTDRQIVDGFDLRGRRNAQQVYTRDLSTGTSTLVSVGHKGKKVGNFESWGPALSADGSAVAFSSDALNLVRGDDNGHSDVFVRNLATATTTLVSTSLDGAPGDGYSEEAGISADGTTVAFTSFSDDLTSTPSSAWQDVFLRDLTTGTTTLVSRGVDGAVPDGQSYNAAISDDGSVVVFMSFATNLVAGDLNREADIFAYDVALGAVSKVSHAFDGSATDDRSMHPIVSGDGNRVAYISRARNVATPGTTGPLQVFVTDRTTGQNFSFGSGFQDAGNESSTPEDLSYDGSVLAFSTTLSNVAHGDHNASDDVYLAEVASGNVLLLSRTPQNVAGDHASVGASMSTETRSVAFATAASDIAPDDTNSVSDVMIGRLPL